ncbi:MAG: hypothetical protein KF901_31680 [Myxococcales bacterium]|nr:hypothetical protein [Myxococcales bacterium]
MPTKAAPTTSQVLRTLPIFIACAIAKPIAAPKSAVMMKLMKQNETRRPTIRG